VDTMKEIRAAVAAERLTEPDGRRSAAHLAAAAGLYAVLVALGLVVDQLWLWVPIWAVLAWLLMGNGAIMHVTSHGHLFKTGWPNQVVGMIAAATILVPWGTYRAFHFEHHVKTAGPEDPEREPLVFRFRFQYLLVFLLGGVFSLLETYWFTIGTIIGRPPRWVRTGAQRRDIVVSAVVTLVFVLGLVLLGVASPGLVLRIWAVPFLFTLVAIGPIVLLPEHHGGHEGEAIENSRTVRSNPLVGWAYWNNNLHAEHHVIPAATPENLPRVGELIRPLQPADWYSPSYTRYHAHVLASIPERDATPG
jgi:fatty acid desaturase